MKKIFAALLLAAVLSGGTGCLKDDGFDNQQYGSQIKEVKAVSFPESQYSPVSVSVPAGPDPLEAGGPFIAIEGGTPAATDITVQVEEDNTLVTALDLLPLPAGSYSINKLAAVIKAGERNSEDIVVTITDFSLLDPAETYGIGFRIKSAGSGYIVAKNQRELVYSITLE